MQNQTIRNILLRGGERYGYYSPVGINNWVMFPITSKNTVDARINEFLINSLILASLIVLIFSGVNFLQLQPFSGKTRWIITL